jgi:hypothetical protein
VKFLLDHDVLENLAYLLQNSAHESCFCATCFSRNSLAGSSAKFFNPYKAVL